MEKKRKIIVISVIGLIIIIIIFFLFYKSKYKEDVPSTGKTNYDISSCISSVTDNTTSYLNNISYNASGDESTLNPYKIIIKNNCTTYITYNITFKINENNYDLNTLFYDIYDKDYKLDNRHALNTMQNNILFSGELNSKESKILLLYIWSTSEINGQNIKGEISVNPDKTMEAAPHYWYSSKDGSLISSIKNNYKITLPKTTPGKEISTVIEKELSRTTDSEGISYYFRGNVDNNYVLFANKCWQIVRITGSGSIKLILYNDNYYNAPNPCNFGLDESNAAFAKYNKDVFQSTYNAKTNDNAYVGFMYGDVNSKSYLKTRQNSNKSIIMKNLENWYENNLVHYEKYLADNISCVDKTIDKNSVENINFTNLGYNV